MPPFHGARLQTYGRLIQDLALGRATTWRPGQSLRMHAVMQALSMEIILTLCGYALPAGVAVGAAIPLAHCNPERYPDPLRFRPECFLEHTYTPFEYLPFGGGARRCVGAAFAVYELKIVLGSILAQHRFELADDIPAIPVPRTFTLGPKGGVPLVYCGPTDV